MSQHAPCPAGWLASPLSMRCYLAVPRVLSTHAGCADVCQSYGAFEGFPAALACIANEEENRFVTNHLLDGQAHWIGLYSL